LQDIIMFLCPPGIVTMLEYFVNFGEFFVFRSCMKTKNKAHGICLSDGRPHRVRRLGGPIRWTDGLEPDSQRMTGK